MFFLKKTVEPTKNISGKSEILRYISQCLGKTPYKVVVSVVKFYCCECGAREVLNVKRADRGKA